jgi:hypothetical protein
MEFQNDAITTNTNNSIDTILNSIRTYDNRNDASTEYRIDLSDRTDEENIAKKYTLPNVIYRFKFTQEFMEELYKFSKIHQYDERKGFKEAWISWTEDNNDIIEEEMTRILNLGYDGDVLDKMFKSARYYFRKKSSEKKEPKQRRPYINVPRELLDAMDQHIEENIYNVDYQPKSGFVLFCKNNEKILKLTISKILEKGVSDSHLIENKIKKTYKNRYFILTNNTNK